MTAVDLPGLERLEQVCHRLKLEVVLGQPSRSPPKAGQLVGGLPLDPVLATVYGLMGHGRFAHDVAGFSLIRVDGRVNDLERRNAEWREGWQKQLALPLLVFAGEPFLAHHFATVPGLTGADGRQPVVWVDVYEEPYALPVASDVDAFFGVYARYLEEVVATPEFKLRRDLPWVFPWSVPHLFARDERLVALLRAGAFSALMPADEEFRTWTARILAVHDRAH